MNDQQRFDDLKQFISATVSQSEAKLAGDIEGLSKRVDNLSHKIDTEVEILRNEMHDGFAGIAEIIEDLNHRIDKRDTVIDKRLARLEHAVFPSR